MKVANQIFSVASESFFHNSNGCFVGSAYKWDASVVFACQFVVSFVDRKNAAFAPTIQEFLFGPYLLDQRVDVRYHTAIPLFKSSGHMLLMPATLFDWQDPPVL